MSLCDKGIILTNGFTVSAGRPVDLKYIASTVAVRDEYVTNNMAYEGMLVYVKEDKKVYQLLEDGWKEFGFNQAEFESNVYDGIDSESNVLALSARQGKVLDTKITNHAKLTSHITEDERNAWNSKAETSLATQTVNGLMSKSDKIKLDGIASNANNYIHPDSHPATMIIEDSTHNFVTDEEKSIWNAKASTDVVSYVADGLMSIYDKMKLDGIADEANNYIHPDTHDASIINQDSNHRFVTDDQINDWNSKSNVSSSTATINANGLMSKEDKIKLDSIDENANYYVHPNDEGTRHVTDEQINKWDEITELKNQLNLLQEKYNDLVVKLEEAIYVNDAVIVGGGNV